MGITRFMPLLKKFYPELLSSKSFSTSWDALVDPVQTRVQSSSLSVKDGGSPTIAYIEDANVRLMKLKYVLHKNAETGEEKLGTHLSADFSQVIFTQMVDAFARHVVSTLVKYQTLRGKIKAYVLVFDHPSSVTKLKKRTQALRSQQMKHPGALQIIFDSKNEFKSLEEEEEEGLKETNRLRWKEIYKKIDINEIGQCFYEGKILPRVTACDLLGMRSTRNKVINLLCKKLFEHVLIKDAIRLNENFTLLCCFEKDRVSHTMSSRSDGAYRALWQDQVSSRENFQSELGEADLLCFFWARIFLQKTSDDGAPSLLCDVAVLETIDTDFFLLAFISSICEWGKKLYLFNSSKEVYYKPSEMVSFLEGADNLKSLIYFFALSGTDFLERKFIMHRASSQKLWSSVDSVIAPASKKDKQVEKKGCDQSVEKSKKKVKKSFNADFVSKKDFLKDLYCFNNDKLLEIYESVHGSSSSGGTKSLKNPANQANVQAAHLILKETIRYWTLIVN